ncbi:hypothetical protein AMECASPLE_017695 [Ameca splendens]|uniref:Uncharacterized protein n=1 Tax=Ameca splendens TaxID=208324 RepID=A0ABV1AB39_9TELE
MAAMGPENSAGTGPGGTAAYRVGQQDGVPATTHSRRELGTHQTLVHTQSYVKTEKVFDHHHRTKTSGWGNFAAAQPNNVPTRGEAPYSFRSPESVEMDEIMAAMVLTSLSCSPVVQSPPQTHAGPDGRAASPHQ